MPQLIIEEPVLESARYFNSKLAMLNGPRVDHLVDRPFTALFEAQVLRNPAGLAVTCGEVSLSFAELNERANQLARHLQTLGVGS